MALAGDINDNLKKSILSFSGVSSIHYCYHVVFFQNNFQLHENDKDAMRQLNRNTMRHSKFQSKPRTFFEINML